VNTCIFLCITKNKDEGSFQNFILKELSAKVENKPGVHFRLEYFVQEFHICCEFLGKGSSLDASIRQTVTVVSASKMLS
jgi:hypothetical protein